MDTVAIIPARSGSKGIPNKNIRLLRGHPLIAYSILAARQCTTISRVFVSTNSPEIAAIAEQYGAEVPFLRPAEFATDSATDRDFLLHAMQWVRDNEEALPEYWVHLRPTTPIREVNVVEKAIHLLQENSNATSLRSAHLVEKTPYKWFQLDGNGYLQGIRPSDTRPEYYNLPRQCFPPIYNPNGYVDVLKASQILNSQSVHGPSILGYITPPCHDLDTVDDWESLNDWLETTDTEVVSLMKSKFGR
jgi:CMP-N,N'-diacetyllegionaminic acid synthase